jgi:tRNA nucleotidyltransferase (CCA-adding enzyme)
MAAKKVQKGSQVANNYATFALCAALPLVPKCIVLKNLWYEDEAAPESFQDNMADYIYLLENRLSPAQRNAIRIAREVARSQGLTVFLVGGAVRDLTSGSPVRDLDLVVQGNALKLRREFEKAGAVITGENDTMQALYMRLPGHVRMEFGSTLTVSFPKPGKPSVMPGTILEDLRRRDFTANAMALSLNDGSYGLLMDPLNGTADIEDRHLRLVSNYGFIEDPARMIRAARLMARLGWMMDEKTQLRYETGKQEGYISALSEFYRGYELEEIFHEEDPLRVMRGLEAEGWMKLLSPFWSSAKANAAEVERLREAQTQLEMQNLHPDNGAANFPLLTAKLSAQEVTSLKASFPRQGFVQEIEALDGEARQFAAQLASKAAALPSQAWRIITSAPPEAVLWVSYSNKNAGVQAKLKAFSTEWPQARQKMPYTQMQEMRITRDLPEYEDLLEKLFFELMDGKLQTVEEMKAFLEPYSPPAPPPPVNLRRMRAAKKEPKPRASKAKAKAKPRDDAAAPESADVVADSGSAAALEKATPASASASAAANGTGKARVAAKPKAAAVVPAPAVMPALAVVPAPVRQTAKAALAGTAKQPEGQTTAAKSSKLPGREVAPGKPSVSPPRAPQKPVPVPAAKKVAVSAKKMVKAVPAAKKIPAKKIPAKKTASKKIASKKTVTPKDIRKKAVVAKHAIKTSTANRSPAKKVAPSPAKKAVGKKTAVKTTKGKPAPKASQSAKKSPPANKSTPGKKSTQKSASSSREAAKKATAKGGRRR